MIDFKIFMRHKDTPYSILGKIFMTKSNTQDYNKDVLYTIKYSRQIFYIWVYIFKALKIDLKH